MPLAFCVFAQKQFFPAGYKLPMVVPGYCQCFSEHLSSNTGIHNIIMETYGNIWKHVETYGNIWKHVETYGNIWKHVETYGNIWKHMEAYGNIWKHVETYGNIWKHVETYGNIWKHVETYGNIWKHMEAYGNIWKLSKCDVPPPFQLYDRTGSIRLNQVDYGRKQPPRDGNISCPTLNCQLHPATIPESVAYFSVDLRIIH